MGILIPNRENLVALCILKRACIVSVEEYIEGVATTSQDSEVENDVPAWVMSAVEIGRQAMA